MTLRGKKILGVYRSRGKDKFVVMDYPITKLKDFNKLVFNKKYYVLKRLW